MGASRIDPPQNVSYVSQLKARGLLFLCDVGLMKSSSPHYHLSTTWSLPSHNVAISTHYQCYLFIVRS